MNVSVSAAENVSVHLSEKIYFYDHKLKIFTKPDLLAATVAILNII